MDYAVIYGIIGGVCAGVFILIEYLLGLHESGAVYISTIATILLLGVTVYISIKDKRDKENYQRISYGHALATGGAAAFIFSLVMALNTLFYLKVLHPEFTDLLMAEMTLHMESEGHSAKAIEEMLTYTKKNLTTFRQMLVIFGGYLVLGSLFSLIMSAFMKDTRVHEDAKGELI